MLNQIQTQLLVSDARLPYKANPDDAGYDLMASENCHIPPLTRKLVRTGISVAIPEGLYGRIAPRSGLALKHGIDVLAGVVDSGYRGEIGVILYNTDKDNAFSVHVGDRIAQLIIEKHHMFDFIEVSKLPTTIRSNKGFGSSGN